MRGIDPRPTCCAKVKRKSDLLKKISVDMYSLYTCTQEIFLLGHSSFLTVPGGTGGRGLKAAKF